ncbi:MAG: hypothetical protein QM610_02355 [Chitinophagaceae bacterium]
MKHRLFALALIASIGFGTSSFAQQKQQHPPVAAQQHDEKTVEVRYYYIPEYNVYFDAVKKVYYYKKNNKWHTTSRPAKINKNLGQAHREPLNDIKQNEKPYDHNAQDIKTWKK